MLPLSLALATASPVDAIARSMADYSACLQVYAGRPNREAAAQRAQFAKAQCHSQRETTIRLGTQLLATRSTAAIARARMEQAVASFDALYPAILAAGGGVEIPLPIAPQVRRYSDCLAEQMQTRDPMQTGDIAVYAASVEPAIVACAAVRTAAFAEAETVLSGRPEFGEAGRRHEAIARAFDQTDAVRRNFLQIMETISHGQAANAAN